MSKVCLLIGEGDSERYFVPCLLEGLGFVPLKEKKDTSTIYSKDDVFWFFPFPPNLGQNIAGGERLKQQDTYRLASEYLKNNSYLWTDNPEIYLIVLYDTDCLNENQPKCLDISNAVAGSRIRVKEYKIFPVILEIESWYFAGLTTNFPYFRDNRNAELVKLLGSKATHNHNKEKFKEHIADTMIGSKDISINVAKHFDHKEGCIFSESYTSFFKYLKDNNLI
jgi:hypothetical protein